MKYLLVLAMSLTLARVADAQEVSGGYMGFSVGMFDYEEEIPELGLTVSDTTTAYRISGGYRFNENFAVEGGWGATSDLEESFTEVVPGIGTLTLNIAADYEIMTVRALGFIPMSSLTLFGGVGYYDADLTASASIPGVGSDSIEDTSNGATLVGGIEFPLERVSIRGEIEWFDTESDVEAYDVSIGILFNL